MKANSKSIEQYLDFANQYGAALTAAPAPIAALRAVAVKAIEDALAQGVAETETIEPSKLDEFFGPDYGINLERRHLSAPDLAAAFHCGVPKLNSALAVVCDDFFIPAKGMEARLPEEVILMSLARAAAEMPEFVEKYLGRLAGCTTPLRQRFNAPAQRPDVATALNTLLMQDGVLLYVPAGTRVESPVQIVNLAASAVPMLNPRRVLIVAEERAEVRVLLCDHTQEGAAPCLNIEVIEVFAAEDSHVELYDIEESNATSNRYWQLYARQADRAHLTVGSCYLHGGRTRNEYRIDAAGNHTETALYGLGICADGQSLDNQVLLRHAGQHGSSRQLFKNALYGDARGAFGGKIIVEEGAAYTDAIQTNRNLLASADARMNAAPQLEIYCDEVKCGHGATTGQLDERAVFYMQTRGITREEAKRMLTQAFMVDVIDNISFEVLRQRLHALVDARLSGRSGNCDTCASACAKDPEVI
ncbi:MAG: Fe-S cluster assembly protein SufD [Muribaculaceae bacterium]|nr:Fe-S cluster assembly protein SufD [Muribaculaceae bacterium]